MRFATQTSSERADWPRLIPAMLIAAVLAVYANSTDGAFVFDDEINILSNDHVHSLWPPSKGLLLDRRVVGKVTLAINYAINRAQPRGYHLVNLAIHAGAGLLVYAIARHTLLSLARRHPRPTSITEAAAPWLAFAIALVWAVHPLNTQAVTYIVQRYESLMAMLFLLTLYSLIRAARSPRPAPWLAASWLACGMGMATKEVMIGAPAILLLYDRAFIAGDFRAALRARWGYYLAILFFWTVPLAIGVRELTSRSASAGFFLGPIGPLDYLSAQPGVILMYLRLAIWPDALCIDWLWPLPQSALAVALPAVAVIALLAASVWACARAAPPWGFLGAWFFIILAPTSSILPIADLMVEHRMYLPLVAVAAVAVLAVDRLIQRATAGAADPARARAIAGGALLAVVTIALGLRTVWRNADYRSPVTIWESTTKVRPGSFRAHNNHGAALLQTAQAHQPFNRALLEQAVAAFDRASQLAPKDVDVLNGMGESLYYLGHFKEAQAVFARGESLAPQDQRMVHKLGMSLMAQGLEDKAAEAFRRVLSFQAGAEESRASLAMILLRRRQLDEAGQLLEQGVEVKPHSLKMWRNLSVVRQMQGRFDEALKAADQALLLTPNDPEVALQVAWIHAVAPQLKARDTARMTQLALRAVDATGGHPRALDTLAAALARIGRFEQAVRAATEALNGARAMGDRVLADQIAGRLKLYQARRPFDDLPSPATQP